MKTFINFRSTTPLHYAKERWCGYLKPHSKLNTQIMIEDNEPVGWLKAENIIEILGEKE